MFQLLRWTLFVVCVVICSVLLSRYRVLQFERCGNDPSFRLQRLYGYAIEEGESIDLGDMQSATRGVGVLPTKARIRPFPFTEVSISVVSVNTTIVPEEVDGSRGSESELTTEPPLNLDSGSSSPSLFVMPSVGSDEVVSLSSQPSVLPLVSSVPSSASSVPSLASSVPSSAPSLASSLTSSVPSSAPSSASSSSSSAPSSVSSPSPPLPSSSSPSSPSSPSHTLSLVLTLSADIPANTTIPVKIQNTLRLLSLYQTRFSFRAILFTHSKRLISRGKQLNLTVVRKVRKNAFGMPVLRAMIEEAKRLFPANHYGYINADILFAPALFPALSLIPAERSIGTKYLIAGRVYDVHYSDLNLNFTSVETFAMSLKRLRKRHGLRNPNSADLFVFSREFPVTRMGDAVIGRRKIDSYVMFFTNVRGIPLIDSSAGVMAVHQGRDTYNDHSQARNNDYYYNSRFYSDAFQRVSTLARASFRIVEGEKGVALVAVSKKRK